MWHKCSCSSYSTCDLLPYFKKKVCEVEASVRSVCTSLYSQLTKSIFYLVFPQRNSEALFMTPFSLLLSLIKLRDNDRPQITYGILWLSGWSEPEFFHLNENLSLSSLSRGKSIPTSMKSLASVSELASALALNGRNSVLPLSQRWTILFWFIKSSYVF